MIYFNFTDMEIETSIHQNMWMSKFWLQFGYASLNPKQTFSDSQCLYNCVSSSTSYTIMLKIYLLNSHHKITASQALC